MPEHAAPWAGRRLLQRALLGILGLIVIAGGGALLMHAGIDPTEEAIAELSTTLPRGAALADVHSWGYRLQGLDIAAAARSTYDLLVVDELLDGATAPAQRESAIRQLQHKADGNRRPVLAYLSIGEAQDYRPYWNAAWVTADPAGNKTAGLPSLGPIAAHAAPSIGNAKPKLLHAPSGDAPAWLAGEDPRLPGNFRVRFWDPGWQALLFGDARSAVDRMIAAGFDGVYLDRADAFAQWSDENPRARTEMISLVARLAAYARTRAPGFIVVMQNAEDLAGGRRLRRVLDAVAKEDLLHAADGSGKARSEDDVEASLHYLRKAQRDGLPVLVVEYLSSAEAIAESRKQLDQLGFLAYFGTRDLERLRNEQ